MLVRDGQEHVAYEWYSADGTACKIQLRGRMLSRVGNWELESCGFECGPQSFSVSVPCVHAALHVRLNTALHRSHPQTTAYMIGLVAGDEIVAEYNLDQE
jgi:hypothetical protein